MYGERGVRLDSKQSIHYASNRRKKRVEKSLDMNETRPWYQWLLPTVSFSRQGEDDRVYADPRPSPEARSMHRSSFLMKLATVFMFGGPYVHANRLRDITLDQIVNKNLLAKYTEKMVAEWRDVALYVGPSPWTHEKPAD